MTHNRIWIWFADNGNIRKWQREPFEEGIEFVPALPDHIPDASLKVQGSGETGDSGEGVPCLS